MIVYLSEEVNFSQYYLVQLLGISTQHLPHFDQKWVKESLESTEVLSHRPLRCRQQPRLAQVVGPTRYPAVAQRPQEWRGAHWRIAQDV